MNKLRINTFIFLLLCLALINANAQNIPLAFHYQAVARNPEGFEVRNANISVKFSIIANDKNGPVQWSEEHTGIVTNDYGIFDLNIGNGERIGGLSNNFNEIPWGTYPHFLKVEINFGHGYLDMGTSRFLSVPYALYALKSGSAESTPGSGENQLLSINGDTLAISNGNSILLTNGRQNLSIVGNTLSIDKGNSITLPDKVDDADADPVNEIQIPNLNGNILTLTKATETTIDLSKYLDNTDSQTITKNGNEILISGGNSIKSDNDTINEMQDIEFVNDTLLSLTKSGVDVNLAKFYDNTDSQTLLKNGNSIEISGGNSIISDNDTTNEIQVLSLIQDTLLVLSNADTINLGPFLNTDNQTLTLSNDTLSISRGNSVVIIPQKVVFSGFTSDDAKVLSNNKSECLAFEMEFFDNYNAFNNDSVFTVPLNNSGIYRFDLTYAVSQSNNVLYQLIVNDVLQEQYSPPTNNTSTFMFFYELDEFDVVKLKLKNNYGSNVIHGRGYLSIQKL